ncbi:hypothetical protein Clacol_005946 [Clathrus columnatus]|uniref:Uncharacterized protein n=1 Tax=Clathrus columnatus TaxID=1419009 RepID=A0AAV5AG92_9AGAM|nr:hypothetical protein Clacol_005946 [Clathrus columnatus]
MRLSSSKRRKPDEHTFKVSALNDTTDLSAGTRSLTLRIDHPGVIWTVIAFDAHVLAWNLDDNPPDHFVRHHIKEASFYGTDVWYLDLILKIPSQLRESPKLKINFIGTKESVQWPAKRGKVIAQEEDRRDLALLEEIHTWLKHKTDDSVDAMLFGTIGGYVHI